MIFLCAVSENPRKLLLSSAPKKKEQQDTRTIESEGILRFVLRKPPSGSIG
uniref:Uncharacterized protein n=1 Tax=viral metagenome TaxID=1070528 RepID=A0A6C0JRA1_9ZZZZ